MTLAVTMSTLTDASRLSHYLSQLQMVIYIMWQCHVSVNCSHWVWMVAREDTLLSMKVCECFYVALLTYQFVYCIPMKHGYGSDCKNFYQYFSIWLSQVDCWLSREIATENLQKSPREHWIYIFMFAAMCKAQCDQAKYASHIQPTWKVRHFKLILGQI